MQKETFRRKYNKSRQIILKFESTTNCKQQQ